MNLLAASKLIISLGCLEEPRFVESFICSENGKAGTEYSCHKTPNKLREAAAAIEWNLKRINSCPTAIIEFKAAAIGKAVTSGKMHFVEEP